MFNTNDAYADAVKGSRLHLQEVEEETEESGIFSKLVLIVLLFAIGYFGFRYYTENIAMDDSLIIQSGLLTNEEDTMIVKSNTDSTSDYISALIELESELSEDEPKVTLSAAEQLNLSSAIGDIVNDTSAQENSQYTEKLRKELGIESSTNKRTVVIQKGDTLQSISNRFYGNTTSYDRIIASNDALSSKDSKIYEGQVITLPY